LRSLPILLCNGVDPAKTPKAFQLNTFAEDLHRFLFRGSRIIRQANQRLYAEVKNCNRDHKPKQSEHKLLLSKRLKLFHQILIYIVFISLYNYILRTKYKIMEGFMLKKLSLIVLIFAFLCSPVFSKEVKKQPPPKTTLQDVLPIGKSINKK